MIETTLNHEFVSFLLLIEKDPEHTNEIKIISAEHAQTLFQTDKQHVKHI